MTTSDNELAYLMAQHFVGPGKKARKSLMKRFPQVDPKELTGTSDEEWTKLYASALAFIAAYERGEIKP